MSSIFSRIIQGEIPSYTVYSDEYVYAFLTIAPHTLGHTLLVPRDEIGNILDVSDDIYSHLMLVAKNILAPAIQRATYCERVGFLVE